MEVGAEHKVISLAQRNVQATQGAFDPVALGDTAAVRCKVPKLVERIVDGFALAAVRFHCEGGDVIPAGLVQGILASEKLCCVTERRSSGQADTSMTACYDVWGGLRPGPVIHGFSRVGRRAREPLCVLQPKG